MLGYMKELVGGAPYDTGALPIYTMTSIFGLLAHHTLVMLPIRPKVYHIQHC